MNWEIKFDCAVPYYEIEGIAVVITLERRPSYCDRGEWIAKVSTKGGYFPVTDRQDGWPRYYFDLDRAKLECEAWLIKRKQVPDEDKEALLEKRNG